MVWKHGLSYTSMGKDRVTVCLRTHCCGEYITTKAKWQVFGENYMWDDSW